MSSEDSWLDVVYCFDANFARPALVSAASCVVHSSRPIRFSFLFPAQEENAVTEQIAFFRQWLAGHSALSRQTQTVLYPVSREQQSRLPKIGDKRFSPATYYRLFLPELIPDAVARMIYLDSDTFVTADLSLLMANATQGAALSAVQDAFVRKNSETQAFVRGLGLDESHYFNAGVLLIDMTAFRREGVGTAALKANEGRVFRSVDQDALNIVCKDRWNELEKRWNLMLPDDVGQVSNWGRLFRRRTDRLLPQGVLHITGGEKPWNKYCLSRVRFAYRDLARRIFPDFRLAGPFPLESRIVHWLPVRLVHFLWRLFGRS